ncbi:MAG: hypothetical protein OEV08_09495, partial [Nitrospira sp.]|nr:hypothetical protein [Nitrospira sp.]
MPLNCEPSNSIGSIRTDTVEASAVSTLSVALAVIILGTALIDPSRLRLLFIPGTFLLGAYGLGLFLEQTTKLWTDDLPTNRPVLILTARLSVGMSLIGLSATILGLIGLYHLTGLLIILGLIWSLLKNLRPLPPLRLFRPTYTSFSGGLAMGLVWCLTWLWATIPPTFYDELAYHLPIAQYALQTGSLPSLPWSFFTYMPHLSDLFLGWGLALAGGIGARAMHFAFWIAVWIAGWAIIESLTIHERRPWIGYVIAGTFASSSTFLFLGALPFAETSLTFAVLASTALLALPAATPWLLIGLLWGFAMSVKLSGLSWVVAGAAAALILKWPVRLVIKAGL